MREREREDAEGKRVDSRGGLRRGWVTGWRDFYEFYWILAGVPYYLSGEPPLSPAGQLLVNISCLKIVHILE